MPLLESLVRAASWLAIVLAANVVVGAYYYLRVIASMYLEPEQVAPLKIQASPWLMIAIGVCLAATVVLGVVPEPLLKYMAK